MQVFLSGIQNFLTMINNYWPTIVIIVGLAIMLYRKIEDYLAMQEDEKIQAAKAQLGSIVLSLVSNAERSYAEYSKAGEIKRSEVIAEIYKQYPILSKVADQEGLLKYIDDLIDEALKTVREIVRMEESENG